LQNNYKQSCNLVAWNLAGLVAWWHGNLWRGSMESLMQVTCNKKHYSIVTYFCITHVKQIIVCVQDWQACNLVPPCQGIPAPVCVRSCNFATSQARTLVFKGLWSSLVMTNSANHALKRRVFAYTLGTYPGGRGCACAPAFFLYYVYPLHNFFCNNAPRVGRCLRMVMMWGHTSTPPYNPYLIPPYPHARACRALCGGCSLAGRYGVWYSIY